MLVTNIYFCISPLKGFSYAVSVHHSGELYIPIHLCFFPPPGSIIQSDLIGVMVSPVEGKHNQTRLAVSVGEIGNIYLVNKAK